MNQSYQKSFLQGYEAFWQRVPLALNPFISTDQGWEWDEGWLTGYSVFVLRVQRGYRKTNFSTNEEFRNWKKQQVQIGKIYESL